MDYKAIASTQSELDSDFQAKQNQIKPEVQQIFIERHS